MRLCNWALCFNVTIMTPDHGRRPTHILFITLGIVAAATLLWWALQQPGLSFVILRTLTEPQRGNVESRPGRGGEGAHNQIASVHNSANATVTYTAAGFSPSRVEIYAGEAVTWLDRSPAAMRIVTTTVPHLSTGPNPGFDQGISTPLGGSYTYTFTVPGEWHYKDLNNPENTGTVFVKAR